MDVPSGNASAPGASNILRHRDGRIFPFFVTVLTIGMLVGVIVACILIWAPYNRVVVFDQPTSTVVHLTSVRLKKGGFVALYLDEGGTRIVGHSPYLPPGYYRDIIFPFEYTPILPNVWEVYDWTTAKSSYSLLVRLFADTGDYEFDESKDTPVLNFSGKLYSKHFRMSYGRRSVRVKNSLYLFFSSPLQYVLDVLFS